MSVNIECRLSHNLDLEGTGLLDCPIRQDRPLCLVLNPHCAAGSARSTLAHGKLYYLL